MTSAAYQIPDAALVADITLRPDAEHWMMLDPVRPFLLLNDDGQDSTDEPVAVGDLLPIFVTGPDATRYASWAWSSNVRWYVVVTSTGLALLDLHGKGWFCPKRSSEFIRLFLEAPSKSKRP